MANADIEIAWTHSGPSTSVHRRLLSADSIDVSVFDQLDGGGQLTKLGYTIGDAVGEHSQVGGSIEVTGDAEREMPLYDRMAVPMRTPWLRGTYG